VSGRRAAPRGPEGVDSTTDRLPGPVRTCVGCRSRADRSALLRVVVVGSEPPRLTPDPARRLPGRGASVHPDPRCVDLADKRRAFPRALRLPGPLDVTPVREHVARQQGAPPRDQSEPTSQSGPPR
jgi:predicted RNA-binding protein YlxR (DUF448 family)